MKRFKRDDKYAFALALHYIDFAQFIVPQLLTTKNTVMKCSNNDIIKFQGDSGGAAIQDGRAVGIVSFGRGCGQAFSPSVFANIASPAIRDFITEHTNL